MSHPASTLYWLYTAARSTNITSSSIDVVLQSKLYFQQQDGCMYLFEHLNIAQFSHLSFFVAALKRHFIALVAP